jgi:hypothetical protein
MAAGQYNIAGTYWDPYHDGGLRRTVTASGTAYTINGNYAADEGMGIKEGAQWQATMTTAVVVAQDTLLVVNFDKKLKADGSVHGRQGAVHSAENGTIFWSDGNRWTRIPPD